jgi:sugar O-acyltransferase (sialic acid O-acetyltransferase NeuD family)
MAAPPWSPSGDRVAERFLIWGCGGHAKVVADVILASGQTIVGYVDADRDRLAELATPAQEIALLTENELTGALQVQGELPGDATAAVIAIGNNGVRLDLLRRFSTIHCPPLVHPTAVVSRSARVGRGSVVFAQAVVNAGSRIGDGVIINTAAVVEHDCVIDDGCHLSPGAVVNGGVVVGSGSWIGAAATVIHGIRVGSGAVVGAGAVVIHDVDEGVTVVGNPARVLEPRG